MSEMEQIMSLFAFDNPSESPLASLMSLSHRAQVASTVNAAILACSEPEKGIGNVAPHERNLHASLDARPEDCRIATAAVMGRGKTIEHCELPTICGPEQA